MNWTISVSSLQALQTLVALAPGLHEFRNLRPVVPADVDADRHRAQQRAGRVRSRRLAGIDCA